MHTCKMRQDETLTGVKMSECNQSVSLQHHVSAIFLILKMSMGEDSPTRCESCTHETESSWAQFRSHERPLSTFAKMRTHSNWHQKVAIVFLLTGDQSPRERSVSYLCWLSWEVSLFFCLFPLPLSQKYSPTQRGIVTVINA